MQKKVLIFSMSYDPFFGGAERALQSVMQTLKGVYVFHLITLRYDTTLPAFEIIDGVSVYRIGWGAPSPKPEALISLRFRISKLLFQFQAPLFALRLHAKERFDAVFSLLAQSAGIPGVLFKYAKKHIPFLLWLQEGDPLPSIEKTMKPLWPLFTASFRKADSILSISNFLALWAEKHGAKVKPIIVPTPLSYEAYAHIPNSFSRKDARESKGFGDQDIVLVTTSRLVKKNGVDTVIEALPKLSSGYKFFIVGEGPDKAVLENLARELGVLDRVVFAGMLGKEETKQALHMSDVFVRPSRSEGLGLSFLEAMAAGIPVIATEVGGIPDFLIPLEKDKKNATGVSCKPNDGESVKEAVLLLSNREEKERIVENAKRLVQTKYDLKPVSEIFSKAISDCIIRVKR